MTNDEIFAKIADIMAEHFDVDKDSISLQTNFENDLNADSIDFVEFILELEDVFSSEIPDEDAETLKTVGDAVNYIASKIN